jgi:hypothetical protein
LTLCRADTPPATNQEEMFFGAIEGTRTPTPLRVHGPEPCASANSATMAILNCNAAAAPRPPFQEDQHFYFYSPLSACQTINVFAEAESRSPPTTYPNFAVIEILAFNTFDTGQPFSAASAYF